MKFPYSSNFQGIVRELCRGDLVTTIMQLNQADQSKNKWDHWEGVSSSTENKFTYEDYQNGFSLTPCIDLN